MKREMLVNFRGKRSQTEMANIYGVSQQAWSKWERGENTPTLLTIKKLENDIGAPMEKIFFDLFEEIPKNDASANE